MNISYTVLEDPSPTVIIIKHLGKCYILDEGIANYYVQKYNVQVVSCWKSTILVGKPNKRAIGSFIRNTVNLTKYDIRITSVGFKPYTFKANPVNPLSLEEVLKRTPARQIHTTKFFYNRRYKRVYDMAYEEGFKVFEGIDYYPITFIKLSYDGISVNISDADGSGLFNVTLTTNFLFTTAPIKHLHNKSLEEVREVLRFVVMYRATVAELEQLARDIIDDTEQYAKWHPEITVLDHTLLTMHSLMFDETLLVSAFFHDMGKMDTTRMNEAKGYLTSYGHETKCDEYIDKYLDQVIALGFTNVNEESIRWICNQHMRISRFLEMRSFKQLAYMENPNFMNLVTFHLNDGVVRLAGYEPDMLNTIDELKETKFNY